MKKLIYILIGIATLEAQGQSDPNFRQNNFNALMLNPAQAGANAENEVTLLGSQSWVGFEGAPRTLTASGNLNLTDHMGLGITGFVDQLGPISSTRLSIDYAYHLDLNEDWRASIGLRGMISSITVDLPSLNTTQVNDPHMMNGLRSGTMFDMGFGGLVYSDKYYFGISMPKIGTTTFMNADMEGFVERRGFISYGGATFDLNSDFEIRPSLVLRYVGSYPLLVDVNAIVTYDETFDFGLNYQVMNSLGVVLGYKVTDRFSVGYAYSFPTTKLNRISFQSHEIALKMKFSKEGGSTKSSQSPRFFN